MKLSTSFIFLKKKQMREIPTVSCLKPFFVTRRATERYRGMHTVTLCSRHRDFITKPFIYTNAVLLLAKKPHDVKFAREEDQTKTLANPSAPALAMYGRFGWKATSYMASSNFFRCEVISWTHVLLSRFQRRIEQS